MLRAEVAGRDREPGPSALVGDERGAAADLNATERPHGLEDEQDAAWIPAQVLEFVVGGGHDDLEGFIVDLEPDRRNDGLAVLAPQHQDGRRWSVEQRAHRLGGVVEPHRGSVLRASRLRREGSRRASR